MYPFITHISLACNVTRFDLKNDLIGRQELKKQFETAMEKTCEIFFDVFENFFTHYMSFGLFKTI